MNISNKLSKKYNISLSFNYYSICRTYNNNDKEFFRVIEFYKNESNFQILTDFYYFNKNIFIDDKITYEPIYYNLRKKLIELELIELFLKFKLLNLYIYNDIIYYSLINYGNIINAFN